MMTTPVSISGSAKRMNFGRSTDDDLSIESMSLTTGLRISLIYDHEWTSGDLRTMTLVEHKTGS